MEDFEADSPHPTPALHSLAAPGEDERERAKAMPG